MSKGKTRTTKLRSEARLRSLTPCRLVFSVTFLRRTRRGCCSSSRQQHFLGKRCCLVFQLLQPPHYPQSWKGAEVWSRAHMYTLPIFSCPPLWRITCRLIMINRCHRSRIQLSDRWNKLNACLLILSLCFFLSIIIIIIISCLCVSYFTQVWRKRRSRESIRMTVFGFLGHSPRWSVSCVF